MKFGIDFGNCNSSVQLNLGNGLIADLEEHQQGIPTLFMHNAETGANHFGMECVNQSYVYAHPDDVVKYIKSLARMNPDRINEPGTVVSGGESYSYRQVIKLYLEYLVKTIKAKSLGMTGDDTVQSVCITVPASSGTTMMLSTEYRDMLTDILTEITGLPESKIYILSEPVAAAIHYFDHLKATSAETDDQTVLVFDLGGGTLDVTVMTREFSAGRYVYNEKKIDGDPDLGGRHWDKALGDYILEAKLGLNSRNPGFADAAEECEFWDQVVKTKHELSTRTKAMCSFFLNEEPQSTFVTRDEFDTVTSHLFDRAMEVTKKLADSYEGTIDKIILVGGSSNMPQIRQAIEGTFYTFDTNNVLLHEPSKAIAKGAAIYLGMISGISTAGVLKSISESTYGWGSINSDKTPPREMIYNNLMKETPFEADGTITVDVDSAFHAVHDDQREVSFVIYESNATADECENGHWLEFGPGQKTCGIEVTVPVPKDYIGNARKYLLYPRLILNKKGLLELKVFDSNDNLLDTAQGYIHK